MGREIIHSVGQVNDLRISDAFAHLFNAAVDISNMRLNIFYNFALKRNNKPEHPMCGGMLRTHVYYIFLLFVDTSIFYFSSINYLVTIFISST